MRSFACALVLLFGVSAAYAGEGNWVLGGKTLSFVPTPNGQKVAHCQRRNKALDCAAVHALNSARTSNLKKLRTASGDANPTALLCRSLGGRPVIGTDARQNEKSFCKFVDGSVCASIDLYLAAKKKR